MLRSPIWPTSTRDVDTASVERSARRTGADPRDRLAFATRLGRETAPLDVGTAGAFFATLVAVATADVALARTVEPHLDAVGILAQAGVAQEPGSTWGVYAAEAPGTRLDAVPADGPAGRPADGATVLLSGTKPWCSLASSVSHALVTAHDGDERVLVAVALRRPGVVVHDEAWVARGMPDVPSGPVDFDRVPGTTVGAPGWYQHRAGFAWGGIGVAACWLGGAVGLARLVRDHARRHPDSELALHALGATVLDLQDAEDAVAGAAARIDGGTAGDAVLLAQVVRSRVRGACERVLRRTLDTLGPGPVASDAGVAARVADLELYLLQDHGTRDVARVGRLALDDEVSGW